MLELWNGIYHKGTEFEFKGDTYTQVDKINTSEKSDGESYDYIIQRKSDGKFLKFHFWDAGERNGYIFSQDEKYPLQEVFPKEVHRVDWV